GRDGIDKSLNDVCLRVRGPSGDAASRKINSRHFGLEFDDVGASAIDFSTKNGTRVDGQRLPANAQVALRPLSTISIAGALELQARLLPGDTGPAALILTRPQNGPEQVYALVRE